jgi:hypothetical protein
LLGHLADDTCSSEAVDIWSSETVEELSAVNLREEDTGAFLEKSVVIRGSRCSLPCLADALQNLYDLLEVANVEYGQDELDMSEMSIAGEKWLVAGLAVFPLA